MLHDDAQIPIGLLTLAEIARQEGVRNIRMLDHPDRDEERAFIDSICDCDVVGFSSICSTYNQAIPLCRRLKAARPETKVLLGGPQASLTAAATIGAFPFVDVIFPGESEHSWGEFIRKLREPTASWAGVPGIVWQDGARIREIPSAPVIQDLGTLPPPALDLYDFNRSAAVTPIEIGRGCPFACSFCSSSPYYKRNFRLKPIGRILEEMDRLNAAYGSRSFYFVQDSFSVKREFVEEICSALRSRRRPYSWYCSARADQMPEKLIATMKESGCRGIYMGSKGGRSACRRSSTST